MNFQTPLLEEHIESSAKMVDFHGWEMPINYGSQISEHHYVRKACGIFDVSHMTIIDVLDNGANDFMKKLVIKKFLYCFH